MPDTVSRAIRSELKSEQRELCAALDEFSGTSSGDGPEIEHHWEFDHPFMKYDDGINTLSDETRSQLDLHDEQFTSVDPERAVSNLRVLVTTHSSSGETWASLDDPRCDLLAEPYDSDGFYLAVHAPEPGDVDGLSEIEIGRWEADNPDKEYGKHTSATGSPVVACVLPAAPEADAITHLLKSVDEEPMLIAQWAETPVETALVGTTMVVTKRYDS
ncbi:hypothetical protein [Streptomyces microflavus]|nr:hypothetical protein [Streptomyces microflavus]